MRLVPPGEASGDATSTAARPRPGASPGGLHPPDRHLLLGISHATDDPARHRTFEVRAAFDVETGEWSARVGEQNLNEQRGDWEPHRANANGTPQFPTAAACLG